MSSPMTSPTTRQLVVEGMACEHRKASVTAAGYGVVS
jgi:hypothetical protein